MSRRLLGATGAWMASQGGGSDFDPARTYIVIDSVPSGMTNTNCRVDVDAGSVIDWGDGSTETATSGQALHLYGAGGPYTLEVFGGTTLFAAYIYHASKPIPVSKINIGDSVTVIGSSSGGFGLYVDASSSVEEVLGMNNVEKFDSNLNLPSLKRFSFPGRVETLDLIGLSMRGLEEFSLGNIKYFRSIGNSEKVWNLGKVSNLDFGTITPTGTVNKGIVPNFRDNDHIVSVNWGKLRYLTGGTSSTTGAFCNCPNLRRFSHDADSPLSTPSAQIYGVFSNCPSLEHKPIDISDAASVSVTSSYKFTSVYFGNPHLFPDHKATIDARAFGLDCAGDCGIEELTVVCGATPTVATFTSANVLRLPNVRKLVLDNVYSTAPTAMLPLGAWQESIDEIVFPRHTEFGYAARALYNADKFVKSVVVKFPQHTMAEVKNLVTYNTTTKIFPFGAPTTIPSSKLYFQCSDGNMDVQGNVIQ